MLAADAIVIFLHEAYLEREPDAARTLEPIERFKASIDLIDGHSQLSVEVDDDGILQAVVALPTGDDVELAITTSALLFGVDREAYRGTVNASREAAREGYSDQADSPDDEGVA